MKIRRTYKYRLNTSSRREKRLHQMINIAGIIWNHCVALQRRTYRLTGKYISQGRLKQHIAKLRMKYPKYAYWQKLNSQTVQDIVERLDKAYEKFFNKQGGRPSFRKVKKHRSFTLKQAGWKLLEGNRIRIGKRTFKYIKHRDLQGTVKTVTIKRDTLGRLWICFSVEEEYYPPVRVSTGKSGGFDFGLKTFLTDHEGKPYMSPQFFKQELKHIRQLNRSLSRKVKGSRNRSEAKRLLARSHIRIADKRRDFHFQLAHDLCDEFDVIYLEDLNIKAMQRLWGRKVSDLGFSDFVKILTHIASKHGVVIVHIDRWERTTGKCSVCGHVQDMELRDRIFECKSCGLVLDRDHNAARNILKTGASVYGTEAVRPDSPGSLALKPEAHKL